MSLIESNPEEPLRHDAFISYSRRDRDFARALGDTLRSYRPPKDLGVAQRNLDIFRDEEDFTGVEYHAAVSRHLQDSGRLILVCSPHSRQSQYVNGEIHEFVGMRSADEIIPMLISGLPNNEAKPGQEDQMAFPDALCSVLAMPLAIDCRGFDARKDKVNKGAFQQQWFALLAAIYGLSRSQIEQREKHREARRRRITRAVVGGVMLTLLAATIVSLFFWRQAVQERTVAVARQLAAQAELVRNQGRHMIERSVLLSVESMKRVPNLEAELVLRPQLRLLLRPVQAIAAGGEIYETAFSADGRLFAADAGDGVGVWEIPSGRRIALLRVTVPVAAMAFSPDGSRLATGSGAIHSKPDTYMAQVWDVQHGREVVRMPSENPVVEVSFDGAGKYLAGADGLPMVPIGEFRVRSQDTSMTYARVWEVQTGKLLLKAPHEATILTIALSPDGQRLATQTNRGQNRTWSVPQGGAEAGSEFASSLFGVAFSPDWSRKTTVEGSTLQILETQTGKELARINEPEVKAPQFIANGEWVIAQGRDGVRVVWSAKDGEEVVRLTKAGKVGETSVSPDRRYLATCSEDHVAQVWDLKGEEVSRLFHENVTAISFTADGGHIVTADFRGTIRIWEATAGREVATYRHEGTVAEIVYSPDGKYVVTNSDDKSLRIWEVSTGREITRVRSEYGVQSFEFSPDWKVMAVAFQRTTRLLEPLTGRILAELKMTEGVGGFTFSPDGREVVTEGYDKVLRIWEVASGRELAAFKMEAAITFRADGMCLAASYEKPGTAVVRELKTGREVLRFQHQEIEGIAFTPEGRYLMAGASGALLFFDPGTGRELHRVRHHEMTPMSFSRDGKYLATGAEDGSALVWRVSDGKRLAQVPPRGGITHVSFNHDGTRLFTSSVDGAARLWNLRTGREISRMQLPVGILTMALSPDGRHLTTGGLGHGEVTAETWYLDSADLIAEACRRLPRNLTRAEWTQFVGNEPYAKTCPNLPAGP